MTATRAQSFDELGNMVKKAGIEHKRSSIEWFARMQIWKVGGKLGILLVYAYIPIRAAMRI